MAHSSDVELTEPAVVGSSRSRSGEDESDESDESSIPIDAAAVNAALRASHGNVTAAARALRCPRVAVLTWMRELGLDNLH